MITDSRKTPSPINRLLLKGGSGNYKLTIFTLLIVGVLIRTVFINIYPNGLNQDEASAGYEAFSILNYGIDRNGKSFPVHFIAWGSGQNALYSYLSIPFIYFFGLNELSIRLPMALLSCASLFLYYSIVKETGNRKFTLISFLLFTIAPWHIMKSRWSLESNIFPDIVLICLFFLLKLVKQKKIIYYYISVFFMALSMYSYGTSYLFIPLFFILTSYYSLKLKIISYRQIILAFILITILSFPIIAFVFINTYNLPEINILGITVPKLKVARHTRVTSVFRHNFIVNSIFNSIKAVYTLVTQSDKEPGNSIRFFGIYYVFSLPFTIVGFFNTTKQKLNKLNSVDALFMLWLIPASLMLPIILPNINRINIVIIPLIYFTSLGLHQLIEKFIIIRKYYLSVYLISFISFTIAYFSIYQKSLRVPFSYSLKEAIIYADNLKSEKIFITNKTQSPYIFTLFYLQRNPNDYLRTVKFKNEGDEFENVHSFEKFHFYIPNGYLDEKNAYIIKNEELETLNQSRLIIKQFDLYSVITVKHTERLH